MKKIIFIILLLFTVKVLAQDQNQNIMDSYNTTITLLDSAGVFTGTARLLRGYNSISITIRADQNGSYKVLFGNTSTITTATAVKTYSFTYTANDTLHTKYIPVDAPYFKVVYTNTTTDQTKFYLITMLNAGHTLPITSDGKLDIGGTVTVTGGATAIRQDSLLNVNKNMRSWLAALMGYVDELEAKNDSLKTKLTSIINELAGGKSYGRIAALSGSAVDTTKGSLFSYWFDASYYATVTTGDTVYASSDPTFPGTNRIVLTAATPYLYTGKLFKSSIPNFYLKRKAGAATISVQIYKRGF